MDVCNEADKENINSQIIQSAPVVRTPNILKRRVPFDSDTTGVKRRKQQEVGITQYIHQSKWIASHYDVRKIIGKGAFGMVYEAVCKSTSSIVAVKEILRKKTSDPRDPAVCEIQLVRELGGKRNILPTIATHQSEGLRDAGSFIVMEYFPHDRFCDVIKVMEEEEVIDYAMNLISSLEYLHEHSIIHRDVKPDNFLYNRKERRYALIDFGLSQRYNKNMDRIEEFKKRYSTGSTAVDKKQCYQMPCSCEGQLIEPCNFCRTKEFLIVNKAGTPRFLAPEVLIGSSKQTTKMDIWAAGIIIFFMTVKNYKYFSARDELAMILELSTIFGTESFMKMAKEHGTEMMTNGNFRKLNLSHFALASRYGFEDAEYGKRKKCMYCRTYFQRPNLRRCFCCPFEDIENGLLSVHDNCNKVIAFLLESCLRVDPNNRISAKEVIGTFPGFLQSCKYKGD